MFFRENMPPEGIPKKLFWGKIDEKRQNISVTMTATQGKYWNTRPILRKEFTMTKADIVDKIHAKIGTGTKAAAEQFLDAAISVLAESIAKGEQVSFTGFGSFKVVERSERKGRNPRTGEECVIPASKVVKFTPGKALKEAVNK